MIEYDGKEVTSTAKVELDVLDKEAEGKITPIADVIKASDPEDTGYIFTIEGTLTSNASGYDKDTAFFDCVYVQDESAGICIFPVSGDYKVGDKVRVYGYTDFYQGEPELQVQTIEVIGSDTVAPTEVTAAQINDRSVEGSLVTLKGTVESFEEANGLIQTIMVKDAKGDVARVFIDGYITTGREVENCAVGAEITVTGLASYDDTFNAPDGPFPRIRVRDRADVVCNTTATVTVEEAMAAAEAAQAAADEANAKADAALAELAQVQGELDQAQEELAQAQQTLAATQEALDQALQNQVKDEATIAQLQSDLEEARNAAEAAAAAADKKAEEAQKAAEEAQKAIEAAQAAQEKSDAKIAELEAALKAAQEAAEADKAEAQAAIDAAKEAQEADAAAIAALKAEIKQLKIGLAKVRTISGLKLTQKSRKVTVKFSKTSGATGYQIQYKRSTSKSWKNLKKYTTKRKAITKKLKKGKKYIFRVRAVTKIDGKKVYGKWVKKSIKIKKK